MDCVLKDLIAVSKDGEWGKGEPFDDSVEMLAIRGTDFEDVRFGFTASIPRRHIAKRHAERKLLQPWDVIIEAAGGTKNQITGRTVLLRPQLFSRSELPFTCASFSRFIRFNTELCDPAFMFWYFQHLYSSGFMHAYHTQHTGVARFQWTTFSEREPLTLPSLPIQKRIAGILSAYDELIENSQRRIKILDAMARALYREWFVHFHFPGHESHPRVASPLGEIPQGWEVMKLGDVFQTVLGGTPSRAKAEYWENGTIAWINSGKVNDLRITKPSELITELALKKSAAKLMPKGTTVLAITGATLGQVSYLEIETAANQSVVGIIDLSKRMSEWIYLSICERIEGIIKHASGGAQQHINKEVVNDVLIALPEAELAARFKVIVEPMFKEIAALQFQIHNLCRTRDLLLPRLLSGQINVEVIALI